MYKIVLSLLCLIAITIGEVLYVYYPSTVKSNVVQEAIQADQPDVTVVVFGKYRDFIMKSKNDSPDAVLVKGGGLEELAEYSPIYSAFRSGSDKEEYVLLSLDTSVELASITQETVIGVVDFKRRNSMNEFVAETIGTVSKVKHVTKVEDLLPLLSFGLAKAVIIPKSDVSYFEEKSNLNFVVTPIQSHSKIAVIASKEGSVSSVDAARAISSVVPEYIRGVEWRK